MPRSVGVFLVAAIVLYFCDAMFCNGIYFNAVETVFSQVLK
jgi:hypothetical protein